MTQDNQGSCFATNSGLFRYDGYALRQYRHDDADPNTISSDDIRTLFKDRSGMLWIGTTARGLDRLDPAREAVTHFRHNNKDPNSLSSDNLICIRQDSSSVLWFGTSNGLNRLEPGKHPLLASITMLTIPRVYPRITSWPFMRIDKETCGRYAARLNWMDRATGRSVRYMHNAANPDTLSDNYVSLFLKIIPERSG
jgi:ligand-binding sensor domain-containing protein